MAGVCCYSSTTFHAATNRRGRDHHYTLPLRIRGIQSSLHTELDISLFQRWILRPDSCGGWYCADYLVLGLLLRLLHKVRHLPIRCGICTNPIAECCKGSASICQYDAGRKSIAHKYLKSSVGDANIHGAPPRSSRLDDMPKAAESSMLSLALVLVYSMRAQDGSVVSGLCRGRKRSCT